MRKNLIQNKLHIPNLLYMISIILFICFNSLVYDSSTKIILNLSLIIFLQLFIFYLFGLDIISGISLLTIWILLPSIMIYYYNFKGVGDLGSGFVPIYMYEDTFYICLFVIVWSFSAYIFHINLLEKKILQRPTLEFKNITVYVNNIIAVVFSIIAFPGMPTFGQISNDANRFQMLLPGHAWNQLAIVALIFNLPYLKKNKSVMLSYLFTVSWFLMHGERADVSGLLFGIFIIIFFSKKITKFYKIVSSIIAIVIIILMINIGYVRTTGYFPNFIEGINSLKNFSTISDMSYVLNVTVGYIQHFPLTHGKILISTLESAIPLVHGKNDVSHILGQYYPYPGGSTIISDQLVDWGLIGIIIIPILYIIFINFILKKKSILFKYEFLVLICSLPRISWYGVYFVFTSMIFFVPIIYTLDSYLNSE